jgi:outer membrane protein TolC
VPLSNEQLQLIADSNAARVTAGQEPFARPITLYEAMARALKYNLDFKVEMMQRSLRTAELRVAHFNMLPNAIVNAGYVSRGNDNSTGERNLLTGVEKPPTTTSYERSILTTDLTFSWNILDFGLSYVRAHQAADRVLIAEEAKRKVIQRVIEDVRTAYWRAVSAERLLARLAAIDGRARSVLASTRKLYADRTTSPITALTYERELVEIRRNAEELGRELSVAKAQLAALMNAAPDERFQLADAALDAKVPGFDVDERLMITTALLNRAELRDVAYQRRINDLEAHAALLELLPGLQLYVGINSDSNRYLENDRWVTWGAKTSWNLMRAFQYPVRRNVIRSQDELLDTKALALTMAIMTQVHVSRIRYVHAARELATAREHHDVQQRLIRQIRSEARAERVSEQTLVREEMNTLVAEARRDIAYAAMQSAFANVFASIGVDPYADMIDFTASVHDLAAQLQQLWFERGDFGAGRKIVITLE